MLNIGNVKKRELIITKAKRRIVFEQLPQDLGTREKVKIASLVAKTSRDAWQSYPSTLSHFPEIMLKSLKQQEDMDDEFHKTFTAWYTLVEKSPYLQNGVAEAAEQTGINIEQLELALETLKTAAQPSKLSINIPPKESKNIRTERGQHDLIVARVLIEKGISIYAASRILAKIRMRDPFAGIYSQKPKIITDVKKETKAIYDRLKRVFD